MKTLSVNLLSFIFATICHAGLLYHYHQLTLMDLDQMTKLVQDKIKEAKKADAPTVPLKEAIQAVYARPDTDRMIDKVVGPLRLELQDMDQYERIIIELTEEALNALKHTKNFKPPVQVTYAIFLENLIADSRNLAASEDGLERKLFKKIKKAKIELTKEAKNERAVRGLPEARSPSAIVADILDTIEQAEQEKAEAQKAEKKAEEEKAKK